MFSPALGEHTRYTRWATLKQIDLGLKKMRATTWSVRLLYWLQLRCICSFWRWTNLCCFPSSCSYQEKNETGLVSFSCWLRVSSLSTSLQASQTLWCSAANKLQGCCKACFFISLHVFLHNGGSLVGQNRTNHRWSRAESPCAWAGIQEDTLPTANHHLNNVSQFIRGWTAPVCKLLDAAFVVKYLNQQWIFPTSYSSSLIPVEEFASHISSFLRLLPSVDAVVLLFVVVFLLIYDGCSFLFLSLFYWIAHKWWWKSAHPPQMGHIWQSCKISEQKLNILPTVTVGSFHLMFFFFFFRIAGCYPEVWILGTLMQRRFNSLLFMSVGDNLLWFCTLLFDFLDYIFF